MDKEIQALPIAFAQHFESMPTGAQAALLNTRNVVLSLASELQLLPVDESLKWGEPSFSVRTGSPFRINWKAETPEVFYLYFHCQSRLVETFRELYGDELKFEGNRAMVLPLTADVSSAPITHCLTLALTYKKVKHLPLLGA